MRKFKSHFIKNSISMLVIVITLLIGIYIITQYENKTGNDINIGGSFELINQNGELYLSELRSKKKSFILWLHILSRCMPNRYTTDF